MTYAILIYETPEAFAARDGDDADAYWGGYSAFHEALKRSVGVTGGKALQRPETAVTVRVRDGERDVQDGPYADTKEQLGGVMLIGACDRDAALDHAARCPCASDGAAELRELMVAPGGAPSAEAAAAQPSVTSHVLLLFADDRAEASRTPEERAAVMRSYSSYTAALREAGVMVGGEPLRSASTGATVRVRGDQILVQDGPYADTKERLAGFYLLACASQEEALDWAVRCPAAQAGAVEVRPGLNVG
ncbi:MAG: YciI family protein [Caulobacterales bacterium]|nr:YciI family protein [Caulobacterales bacterium]